ncbi:efflux RND transporter periplasmic adaptor subunit [Pseudomaricurvus sp. HS19]|uniref:efflux RND transporter periplasmic adaptor subunit n=1 Tax=Pseudomaricurvus sp. HS19 TaxID=2692626 RepID=UPI0013714D64|nr:efflux RND transporter periplasmic adaptor subunit [Pseudomaricurvus sp. HS19]MYM61904.1 efflux RND transporter periplasmic adaptor subunit [Pseudomaricurvus sp. HS19]
MNAPTFTAAPEQSAAHNKPELHSSRSRKLGALALAVVFASAIFAALFGWKSWREAGAAPAPWPAVAVSALQLTPTDVPVALRAVGSLRAVREVALAPETAGRVVSVDFEAGQQVAANSLLVQLFDAPERADRAAALAQADLAKAQLQRSRSLAATGAEAKEVLDQRIAQRDQALATVQQMDARIEQKQIRAPFAGQLGIRQIDLGQYLNPGDTIVTLTDTSQLFVDFSLPQQKLRWLQTTGSVDITSDAWPKRIFSARVATIEPRVDPATRNIRVRALLDNGDSALRPGMFVNAALQLPPETDQLVLPATAIQTTALGDNVLVIRGDEPTHGGQADYVRVTVERRLGNQVVVSGGLNAGDVIITEGQLKVPPGAQVQVAKLHSAEEH